MQAQRQLPREIGKDLRSASDEQLSQVVAIVDAMSARGAADDLIDLVRPRLATLRPVRPMSLSRVLFSPLDPVIVESRQWRPETATIPRSALGPMNREVMVRLGDLANELKRAASGASAGDREKLNQVGTRLWPAAGAAIKAMPQPHDWRQQTGLSDELWTQIRETVALILSAAVQMDSVLSAEDGQPGLRGFLAEHRMCNQDAFAVLVRILLARHQNPALVLGVIASFRDRQTSRARDLAIGGLIAEAPPALRNILEASPAAASNEAVQLAAFLTAVEAPETQDRVRKLRKRALDACQSRLERCLEQDMMALLADPSGSVQTSISAAERAARDAGRLEKAARALGGQQHVQAALRKAADGVVGLRSEEIDLVDRIRLVEILLGPEDAALLDRSLMPR